MCDLLTTEEAAKYLGYAEQTLCNMRSQTVGPAYHKIRNRVRYDTKDLDRWLDSVSLSVKPGAVK